MIIKNKLKFVFALIGLVVAKFTISGAILGFIIGYWLDAKLNQSSIQDRQAFFLYASFSVMGHIAKSSGRVTPLDIQLATFMMDKMHLTGQTRIDAQSAFKDGKEQSFNLYETLNKLKMISFKNRYLLQLFFDIQIQTVLVDGVIHSNKKAILFKIASSLNISRTELEKMIHRYTWTRNYNSNKLDLNGAYEILGVSEKSTGAEIKKAYKKLMSENHPDKLASKGLSKEMMEIAQSKTQDIQKAYELLKSS